jgi:hypothetical protein
MTGGSRHVAEYIDRPFADRSLGNRSNSRRLEGVMAMVTIQVLALNRTSFLLARTPLISEAIGSDINGVAYPPGSGDPMISYAGGVSLHQPPCQPDAGE